MRKKIFGIAGLAATMAIYQLFSNKNKEMMNNAVISQNSGLFTAYTTLFSNSILIPNKKMNKTILIKQPFWLDEVDNSRLDTFWGQSFLEYPPLIREKILILFPEARKQERLTFRQMQELRQAISFELKQQNDIDVIEGECVDIRLAYDKVEKFPLQEDHLFPFFPYKFSRKFVPKEKIFEGIYAENKNQFPYLLICRMENNKTYTYEIDNKFKLYNFCNIPRPNELIKEMNNGKDLPPQTELYKFPKGKEPKRIIVFGSGLSAVWICEQASSSDVYIVMRNIHSKLPTQIKRNEKTSIGPKQLIYNDETDFLFLRQCWYNFTPVTQLQRERKNSLSEYAKKHEINLEKEAITNPNFIVAFKKESGEILALGTGYNALGYVENKSIARHLPEPMVEHIHFDYTKRFFAPKNLPGGALFDRHNEQLRVLAKCVDPIFYVDIEALFIREEDKPCLAGKLEVELDFIHYLCDEIKKLEDTPENSREFIKQQFILWRQNQQLIADNQIISAFNVKVDALFEERKRYFNQEKQTVSHRPSSR